MRLFSERGCHHCHGALAEGTRRGPRLRRREAVTIIDLATGLWTHGPKMYQATRDLGVVWPSLTESDVGDLVGFLNSLREEGR